MDRLGEIPGDLTGCFDENESKGPIVALLKEMAVLSSLAFFLGCDSC